MASKSFQNIACILAVIDGLISLLVKEHQGNSLESKVMAYAADIFQRVQECYSLWPGDLDEKTMARMDRRIIEFEKRTFNGNVEFLVATSAYLGLLDDLVQRIKDPIRKLGINGLINALWDLHRHFDCHLDRSELYLAANAVIKIWYDLEKG